MRIAAKVWDKYIADLRKVSTRASEQFRAFLLDHPAVDRESTNALIDLAYALATKYGEAAGELAAQMYDAVAAASGLALEPAVLAETATIDEAAKAVVGTLKTGNPDIVSDAVARMVKMTGVDTTMRNAIRDGAEWAWIPRGDTCAFCIALASNGWQRASAAQMKGGHAEHIHANCDCTFAIRFDSDSGVAGYDPRRYLEMYDDAEGSSSRAKINAMRRQIYAENSEEINAQKRDNYEKRQERESSAAEEADVS